MRSDLTENSTFVGVRTCETRGCCLALFENVFMLFFVLKWGKRGRGVHLAMIRSLAVNSYRSILKGSTIFKQTYHVKDSDFGKTLAYETHEMEMRRPIWLAIKVVITLGFEIWLAFALSSCLRTRKRGRPQKPRPGYCHTS